MGQKENFKKYDLTHISWFQSNSKHNYMVPATKVQAAKEKNR